MNVLCLVWLKFWRRRFLNFVNVFLLFRYYLPLAKSVTLHLNKPEFPSSKDALCQSWLKFAQWFWRRFLNFVNVFLLSPWKRVWPFIWGNSPHQRMFLPSSFEIGQVVQNSSREFQVSGADNSLLDFQKVPRDIYQFQFGEVKFQI